MHVNTVLPAVAAYFTLQKNRGRSQGPWSFPLTDRTRLPISLSGSGFVSCSHGQLQERTKESYTTTTPGTFIMPLTSHLRQAIGFLRILEQVTSRPVTSHHVKRRYVPLKLLGNATHGTRLRRTQQVNNVSNGGWLCSKEWHDQKTTRAEKSS